MDTNNKISIVALVFSTISIGWDGFKYFHDKRLAEEQQRPHIEAGLFAEGGDGRNGFFMENTGHDYAIVTSLDIEDGGVVYNISDRKDWFKYLGSKGLNPICYRMAWIDKPHRLKPNEPQILLGVTKSGLCPAAFMQLLPKTKDIKGSIKYKSSNGKAYSASFNSWYGN